MNQNLQKGMFKKRVLTQRHNLFDHAWESSKKDATYSTLTPTFADIF